MAHLTINFKSDALRMPVVLDVLLPKQCENCKSLYLLHGRGGDRESWLLRSRVADYAEGKPIAVVMPSGNNNFFVNSERSKDYETFISEELPAQMKLWLGLSDKEEDRFVGEFGRGKNE